MNPKVTVLMSVYNGKKYLRESIESILNQTYENFEFLIIDDGSTDESIEILQYYLKIDKRIKLIVNKSNQGLSSNLATGVDLAATTWIARMDADDISIKNRLELQMNYIISHPDLDILGGYAIDIDENGNELEPRKVPTSHEKISSLIWTCPFIHPTVMFRREAIIKAGSYNKKLIRRQDYDLWFRCSAAKLKFANMDVPLIYYRFTDDYFKKNNFKVQLFQAKMGWKGSKLVKASPIAYVGITIAFLKGILPYSIRRPINEALKKIDPRRK